MPRRSRRTSSSSRPSSSTSRGSARSLASRGSTADSTAGGGGGGGGMSALAQLVAQRGQHQFPRLHMGAGIPELHAIDAAKARLDPQRKLDGTTTFHRSVCLAKSNLGRPLGTMCMCCAADVKAAGRHGDRAMLSGQYAAAHSAYTVATRLDASSSSARARRGVSYLKQRQNADPTNDALLQSLLLKALTDLEAAARAPDGGADPLPPYALGVARAAAGDEDGAASSFAKALRIDPECGHTCQHLLGGGVPAAMSFQKHARPTRMTEREVSALFQMDSQGRSPWYLDSLSEVLGETDARRMQSVFDD